MGYHNYYSDRRIIPGEFLDSNYGDVLYHPALRNDYSSGQGCLKIGTDDLFFDELYNSATWPNAPYVGQAITLVKDTGIDFINNHTPQSIRNGITISTSFFSKATAQEDINSGRPIVLGMHPFTEEASFHVVVAYGYAQINGTDGFLVHYGHGSKAIQVWVPASWFAFQLRMQVNTHEHLYAQDEILSNSHQVLTCTQCGASSVEPLYNVSGSKIVSTNFHIYGNITIPQQLLSYDLENAKYINSSITEIGDYTFYNQTDMLEVEIHKNITIIGDKAFNECSKLFNVTFQNRNSDSNSLVYIGNAAFMGCALLNNISLPKNIEEFGFEAFATNTSLVSFDGNKNDINFVVVDGTKALYEANGWEGFNIVEMAGTGSLAITSGSLIGDVEIPACFNERIITSISSGGFANQTELTSVELPSIVTIESQAFKNCSSLESVYYLSVDGLLDLVDFSTSYTNNTYYDYELDVDIISNVTYTLEYDYSDLVSSCSLSEVYCEILLGEQNFKVHVDSKINYSSSSGSQTLQFTINDYMLSISNRLWCRFIGTETNQDVSISISNIELSFGVNLIKGDAFEGCEKLASSGLSYNLLSDGEHYSIAGIVNDSTSMTCYLSKTIFIPSYLNNKEVVQIAENAFRENETIKWLFVQSKISSMGNSAFKNCINLEVVNLKTTAISRIEESTFEGCKMGTFIYPNNLVYVGKKAFMGTGALGAIPDSVTTIDEYAYANRSSSMSFVLPNSLNEIKKYAFANCKNILLSNLDCNLSIIGDYAFYNTKYLNSKLPNKVTSIGQSAFENSSLPSNFILPANNQLTTIGAYAFKNSNLTRIVLSSKVTTIGSAAFYGNSNLTIYTECSSKPSGWSSSWNNSNRPVIMGCTLSSDKSYVNSFSKTSTNPSNIAAENGISNPYREDYSFGGYYTTSDFSGTKYTDLTSIPNGMVYIKWSSSSCVSEGTQITLSDGTTKRVEDLTGNETLLVWDMFNGYYSTAPILFIDSEALSTYNVINLTFSDGTIVKVISDHGFFDITLNKYVYITEESYLDYIGHYFNKGNINVQLINANIEEEYIRVYSPVTYGHLCYYVNGMLSMPGNTESFTNIFEIDTNTMRYINVEEDIATYGLYTYEEFCEIIELPEEVFNAFNGQYLKVAIGKGITTLEEIQILLYRYSVFFD